MSGKTFIPEFKRECAVLILYHGYTTQQACKATDVGSTALHRWVRQLLAERSGGVTTPGLIVSSAIPSMLERLLSLLSAFEVLVWMTDDQPLNESRLNGKLHLISKLYTQRTERHNLNQRRHLSELGRKSLSFSKPVKLYDKVTGN